KHRMAVGGLKSVHKHRRQVEKHIHVLENQLNLATVKFNTILTKNRNLREEINNLRIHKEIYAKLFNKLNAKLQHQKKLMKEIVQESVLAYDQRMEAESRIIAVRERSEKDIQLYNTEIKELMRVIDHEAKLKEFMLIKFRQLVKEDRLENKLGKKSPKELEYETYENAYTELKKLTGLDSLYTLGSQFLITEEKNYALFNFVNELNRQMEVKQERILNLKVGLSEWDTRICCNEILQFENRRMEKEQTNKYEKLGKRTTKTLEQLKSKIEITFRKIKCDPTIIYQKLCGREGISNSNTMVYLGLIEKKAVDLLRIHMLMLQTLEEQHGTPPLSPSSSASSVATVNVLFAGADLISTMKPIKIVSPVLIDESDDDMSTVIGN
uniref:ODAD1 central coiled coil region domain-containing protein n=1 Tax=Callorhinchus milii TaxID=7868 RepID=A0A4W3HBX1_CALMI